MRVLLNSDTHTDGRQAMAGHLEAVVREKLGHLGERLVKVEAHLSDATGPAESHSDEIHCTLVAELIGLHSVVVTARAATAYQAIHAAVGKLERAIASEIGKHDPRHRVRLPDAEQDTGT